MNFNFLNRYFTKKELREILSERTVKVNLLEEVKSVYSVMSKTYRNEFFYKNTLFNKLVLGKYSPTTSVAFSEVAVAKSKADFILFNHLKGMVFEIKTDLDNLERLVYQIKDYYQVFDTVYVVTSENNYYPVYKELKDYSPNVGIYVLTDRETLSIRKKPIVDKSHLNHTTLFKLLRKKEYEKIILDNLGALPEVKPVHYYKACLNIFSTLDVGKVQKAVFKELKNRKNIYNMNLMNKIPYELKWLVYQMELTEEEHCKLIELLKK